MSILEKKKSNNVGQEKSQVERGRKSKDDSEVEIRKWKKRREKDKVKLREQVGCKKIIRRTCRVSDRASRPLGSVITPRSLRASRFYSRVQRRTGTRMRGVENADEAERHRSSPLATTQTKRVRNRKASRNEATLKLKSLQFFTVSLILAQLHSGDTERAVPDILLEQQPYISAI